MSAAFTLLAACGRPLAPRGQSAPAQGAGVLPNRISSTHSAIREKALLYASSNYNCSVYVFTYPAGSLVQTLDPCALGFGPAFGLCTDKSGNVFMAMGEGSSIFEFAHGGTTPIEQLENFALLPVGCSVDPTTGNLAVGSAAGNVAVFKNASGNPQIYTLANVSEFFFCTYDDRGNLFVNGEHNDRSFALAELPKGGAALQEIKIAGKLQPAYGIQWDGRRVAIGQPQVSNQFDLDRIRVAGSAGRVVGSTTLSWTPNTATPFQFWIHAGTLVQPDNRNAEIGFWNYPAGGRQTKEIKIAGSTLVGVTVSVAPLVR